MPHTQLKKAKMASKPELISYVEDELEPQFDTHPLLELRLDAALKQWKLEVAKLADDAPSIGAAPQKDAYLAPALVESNKKAANSYFSTIGMYALALAEEGPPSLLESIEKVAAGRKQVMESLNTAYESAFQLYQDAVEKYAAQQDDLPTRTKEYQKQFYVVRGLLNTMIDKFNSDSKYDEQLYESEVETFFSVDYQKYVPTYSFFNNAAGGTLYYDFQWNQFQLHFHLKMNAAKAEAVRLKRYGQQIGRKRDGAWGMVEHFMKAYPPNWTAQPRRW